MRECASPPLLPLDLDRVPSNPLLVLLYNLFNMGCEVSDVLLGVYPLFFGQVFVRDTRMRSKLHAVLAVVVLSGRQTLQCPLNFWRLVSNNVVVFQTHPSVASQVGIPVCYRLDIPGSGTRAVYPVDEAPEIQRALERLTPREHYDRQYRMKLASHASVTHKDLPKEQWVDPKDDVRYLTPHIEEVVKENEERAAWDSIKVQRK